MVLQLLIFNELSVINHLVFLTPTLRYFMSAIHVALFVYSKFCWYPELHMCSFRSFLYEKCVWFWYTCTQHVEKRNKCNLQTSLFCLDFTKINPSQKVSYIGAWAYSHSNVAALWWIYTQRSYFWNLPRRSWNLRNNNIKTLESCKNIIIGFGISENDTQNLWNHNGIFWIFSGIFGISVES